MCCCCGAARNFSLPLPFPFLPALCPQKRSVSHCLGDVSNRCLGGGGPLSSDLLGVPCEFSAGTTFQPSQESDTQVISEYVRYFLHQHTIQLGQPATVKVAANLIRLLAYQNKNILQAGMIVGGWDKYEGGQIFSVPLGGTILKQPFAIGGSGSSYLYALLDHEWKEGMSQEEAEKFVVKVVSLAMARDGASGGVVRTVTINAYDMKRNFYPGDKLPLWHDELEPHNSLLDILAAGNPDPMVQ
ncbi:unnamed protein product [Miscanthus lutarioriparius]|uniref:Proteasome endopeptidase complex n=1 Tax=Miscanthus lutarioriparius TaxID=422564 RepID=A0A811SEZ1_9POAL|nr:unnamed protein product [Miscanthus lutarioriparius]